MSKPSPALVQSAHGRALESALMLMGLGSLKFEPDGDVDQALRSVVHEWLVIHAIHGRRAVQLLKLDNRAREICPNAFPPPDFDPKLCKAANGKHNYFSLIQTIVHTPRIKVILSDVGGGKQVCLSVKIRTADHKKDLIVSPYSLGASFSEALSPEVRRALSELVQRT